MATDTCPAYEALDIFSLIWGCAAVFLLLYATGIFVLSYIGDRKLCAEHDEIPISNIFMLFVGLLILFGLICQSCGTIIILFCIIDETFDTRFIRVVYLSTYLLSAASLIILFIKRLQRVFRSSDYGYSQ